MRKASTIVTLAILLLACKSDQLENSNVGNIYAPYGLMTENLYATIASLETQIQQSMINLEESENNSIDIYHNLTSDYVNFLDQTIAELIELSDSDSPLDYSGELSRTDITTRYFFNGSGTSSKGNAFTNKTDGYREQILPLVTNEELKFRITKSLLTHDVENRYGQKSTYLEYYYKDIPLIASIMMLANKKRSILENELNFICLMSQ